jgi:hypothetical protein
MNPAILTAVSSADGNSADKRRGTWRLRSRSGLIRYAAPAHVLQTAQIRLDRRLLEVAPAISCHPEERHARRYERCPARPRLVPGRGTPSRWRTVLPISGRDSDGMRRCERALREVDQTRRGALDDAPTVAAGDRGPRADTRAVQARAVGSEKARAPRRHPPPARSETTAG